MRLLASVAVPSVLLLAATSGVALVPAAARRWPRALFAATALSLVGMGVGFAAHAAQRPALRTLPALPVAR